MIGIMVEMPSLSFPFTAEYMAGVPADLYYPDVNTTHGTIDDTVQAKAKNQAPIVVVDISRNKDLNSMDQSTLESWVENTWFNDRRRSGTMPMRVLIIHNGDVVYDTSGLGRPTWGPTAEGVA